MRTILFAAAVAMALAAASASAGTLTTLDDAQNGYLSALSRNGRIATGSFVSDTYAGAFRWRKDVGSEILTFGSGMGMTSWAQPIAGSASDPDGNVVAALAYSDSQTTGPVIIGPFPGAAPQDAFYSQAYGISDGGIVVGLAQDPSGNAVAFRWTATDGMTRLAVDRPDTFSRANGISADGSVIYGWNDQETGYREGVIWIKGVPIALHNPGMYGDAFGSPPGEAFASTRDGRVVVGQGYYNDQLQSEAWRWTAASGAQPIGILTPPPIAPEIAEAYARLHPRIGRGGEDGYRPDGFFYAPQANPVGISDDGNVIVGNTGDGATQQAFIWTPDIGMVLLADYAPAHGIAIPDGMFLISAGAISSDGQVIGGIAIDPTQSYVVSWVMDFHETAPHDTLVTAQGTIASNDLAQGPFAGYPQGAAVSMTFRIASGGTVISPGHETAYAIDASSFALVASYQDPNDFSHHTATETLPAAADAVLHLVNDDPRADGVELPETATATAGQTLQFALSNPDGILFDSPDSDRIDRTFAPTLFDTKEWTVRDGAQTMTVALQWVTIMDQPGETIFGDGFDGS
jgi:probable HAF family extracellular repeat protein